VNKRGFVQDALYFVVILFVLVITVPILYMALSDVASSFTADPQITDQDDGFQELTTQFPSIFDWTLMFIFIGIVIGGMIVSYLVPANPLIFIMMIFILLVFAALAGFLSNAYDSVSGSDTLTASYDNFPMSGFLLDNYLLVTIVVFFLFAIAFYSNPEGVL